MVFEMPAVLITVITKNGKKKTTLALNWFCTFEWLFPSENAVIGHIVITIELCK